jgi:hypothetical protein
MGRACDTYGKMRNLYKILMENLKGRDHLVQVDFARKIILKWITKKRCELVGWIKVAENSVQ